MKKWLDWKRSIYVEMVLLLIGAALLSVVFFFVTQGTVTFLLNSYIKRTEYNKKHSARMAAELQEFVDGEEITRDRLAAMELWSMRHPVLMLQIYDDGALIYDSVNGIHETSDYEKEDNDVAAWENFYELNLSGYPVEICIYGSFDYGLRTAASFLVGILSFALFFVLFLSGIRVKIKYLQTLQQEIELLEGGSLEYPISVRGRDEMAELASGLNAMRISFLNQMEMAETLSKANRTMVTQISHDLRTPLTAILLYAEILQKEKNLPQVQRELYLEKIMGKIRHMKDLSDQLLQYAVSAQVTEPLKTEPVPAGQALLDELSDLSCYLQEQGFQVETELDWGDAVIAAEREAISRIFNNLASNIIKYADPAQPIILRCAPDEQSFWLELQNTVTSEDEAVESNGIGVESVRSLMRRMGGRCETTDADPHFRIRLTFPLAKEE